MTNDPLPASIGPQPLLSRPLTERGETRPSQRPIPPEFLRRQEATRRRLLSESPLRFRLRHALLALSSAIDRMEAYLWGLSSPKTSRKSDDENQK